MMSCLARIFEAHEVHIDALSASGTRLNTASSMSSYSSSLALAYDSAPAKMLSTVPLFSPTPASIAETINRSKTLAQSLENSLLSVFSTRSRCASNNSRARSSPPRNASTLFLPKASYCKSLVHASSYERAYVLTFSAHNASNARSASASSVSALRFFATYSACSRALVASISRARNAACSRSYFVFFRAPSSPPPSPPPEPERFFNPSRALAFHPSNAPRRSLCVANAVLNRPSRCNFVIARCHVAFAATAPVPITSSHISSNARTPRALPSSASTTTSSTSGATSVASVASGASMPSSTFADARRSRARRRESIA
mmetsp:Transcript_3889/g.14097  ORF Transcript_3889/g.14097 Transcript_3889/m.14097 type:complete len:317 (-) Transcript_3889:835-1785(-)